MGTRTDWTGSVIPERESSPGLSGFSSGGEHRAFWVYITPALTASDDREFTRKITRHSHSTFYYGRFEGTLHSTPTSRFERTKLSPPKKRLSRFRKGGHSSMTPRPVTLIIFMTSHASRCGQRGMDPSPYPITPLDYLETPRIAMP